VLSLRPRRGAAAWFGGSLMGAVAVNGASRDVKDPAERAAVATAGWARWTPFAVAAIGAHLGEQQRASEQLRNAGWGTVARAARRAPNLVRS